MKKSVLIVCLSAFVCSQAFAQRAVKTLSASKLVDVQQSLKQTESIKLETAHEMLVTPLVASVKVLTKNNDGKTVERRTFTGTARQDVPGSLAGNEYLVQLPQGKWVGEFYERELDKLKAQVIYDFCRETGADLIVLPQFNIRPKTQLVDAIDADGNTVRSEQPVEHNGKYVMIVEAVGFPAVYTGFREGTPTDEWIKRVYKMGQNDPENKQIRSEAEIASVKK